MQHSEDNLDFPLRVKTYLPWVNSYRHKWKLVKIGGMEPPPEVFVIKRTLRMRNRGYLWIAASAISDVTLFGWEFQYLHLPLLDQTKAWQICIRTRCIHRAQPLDIDSKTHFRGWIGAHILETILPMIQDLPNLRTFKLSMTTEFRHSHSGTT